MHIGIGIRIGKSSGSNWTPQSLGTKGLFWGKVSEITSGKMYNKVTGRTAEYLTIGGSAGTYTFQATGADYIAADTDYIWFKTDTTQRTTTEAELVGYDLPRTPVKYDNTTSYAIREILILKAGETLTTAEENQMRDYMRLSIWWNNISSNYGATKGNREGEQSIWTPESVATTPTVTTAAISAILDTTASSGGNVTADGGASVTARGVCWSTSANPTTTNSKTTDSSGTGVFTSSITGLTANTVYHVRAYATNSEGTTYGADVQFETLTLYDTFTDTNGTLLHNHTMNAGAGWTELAHTWSTQDGKALAQILSDTSGKVICEGGKTNFELSVDYQMPSTIDKKHASLLLFRFADVNNFIVFGIECDAVNHPYIFMSKSVSGTSTDIFKITDYLSHVGEVINLRVTVNNNVINCYVNSDLTSIPHTVTDLSANTKVGLLQYATGVIGSGLYEQLPFDNFKLRAI